MKLSSTLALLALCGLVFSLGCSSQESGGAGDSCVVDGDCSAGNICQTKWYDSMPYCIVAAGDDDKDGIPNDIELKIGTNPQAPDTDNDGVADKDEVGFDFSHPLNRDKDPHIDALESNVHDYDCDCLLDVDDPANETPATETDLAYVACGKGVCAAATAEQLKAICPLFPVDPNKRNCAITPITCDQSLVPGYEGKVETKCDGLDNNCDGVTDEGLSNVEWSTCGKVGVCSGVVKASCQLDNGEKKWICDYSAVQNFESTEKSCDGLDNDCDGTSDEKEICEDGVPCTDDICDPNAKVCNHVTNAQACDDKNPCTDDVCDTTKKACSHLDHVGACDDGNACTVGDACQKGKCVSGEKKPCNDSNVCTNDYCDPNKGCVYEGIPDASPCVPSGNKCVLTGACLKGQCEAEQTKQCDDNNGCTTDYCNGATGECEHVAVSSFCDDGNACTKNDQCQGGLCKGSPVANCCASDIDCADTNPCTVDTCKAGLCTNDAKAGNGLKCDDGNICTLGDHCANGLCIKDKADACDDANPCTLDTCEPASGCKHALLPDGANCDDKNVCNGVLTCQGGACLLGKAALECNDKNPCTIDTCDAQTGCKNVQTKDACDDGNACTVNDTCATGACIGVAANCDDKNACTSDGCDPNKGCSHAVTEGTCTDFNDCTVNDSCALGKCLGQAKDCSDNNDCTVDSCVIGSGCKHDMTAANGAGCEDGNLCTVGDVCGSGVCKPGKALACGDKNACTDDACDPLTGLCAYTFNTGSCDDGVFCTDVDVCVKGRCKGTPAAGCCTKDADCNDKNPCTMEACTGGACTFTVLDGSACDDGNICTKGDKCTKGACIGTADVCDDGKPCTKDWCEPLGSGCAHITAVSGPCFDGNVCNGSEQCSTTGCLAGTSIDCDDDNPCTLDGCDPIKGCVHTFLSAGVACNDGVSCTAGDLCDGKGKCTGTPTNAPGCCKSDKECDDDYSCTLDSCSSTTYLCTHQPITCADKGVCTFEFCQGGKCLDADVCTAPLYYSENFDEGNTPGYSFQNAGGTAWALNSLVTAGIASKPYGMQAPFKQGSAVMTLPPLALPTIAATLKFQAKVVAEGTSNDCNVAKLSVRMNGKDVGTPYCQSSNADDAMVSFVVPLTGIIANEALALSFVFDAIPPAGASDTKGAFIDSITIVSPKAATACGCGQ